MGMVEEFGFVVSVWEQSEVLCEVGYIFLFVVFGFYNKVIDMICQVYVEVC